jgi:hypothetical protein
MRVCWATHHACVGAPQVQRAGGRRSGQQQRSSGDAKRSAAQRGSSGGER